MGERHSIGEDRKKLQDLVRSMQERQEREWREAASFEPGELTPEEEKLVRQKGLNALNYILQHTLQKQSEMLRSPRQTSQSDIGRQLAERFDGFGYGVFLAIILFFAWSIGDTHGPLGGFCGLLMFAVLELSYRLSTRG